ncbi:MAG: Phage shock protein A [Verrucomicrobia bacterium ADurb.Bin474]|nr:MAG: Phage shock protein A [Verrucomicrobia bacterium ADurb.Bin474]
MLDKAEDPEKLIRLMIREMEDTLVEIKASCAGSMAQLAKSNRELADVREKLDRWTERAQLAIDRGRDDLAREALLEKRAVQKRTEALEEEAVRIQEIVLQYKNDIKELESKLEQARNKHKVLIQRHVRARQSQAVQSSIRKVDTKTAMMKFESFEQRIDRMEADADLVNYGVKKDLDSQFADLERDEDIEKELEELRQKKGENKPSVDQDA